MGFWDALRGRAPAAAANLDSLFMVPSAAITLETAADLTPTGVGAVCFRAAEARAGEPFSERDVLLARMIASHASLLVRAVEPVDGHSPATGREATIELAGRALAVAAEESRSAERIARLALEATGARSCVLWRSNGRPEPVASAGLAEDLVDLTSVVRDADELLSVTGSVALEGGLVLVRLGEPCLGGLRLVFDPSRPVA